MTMGNNNKGKRKDKYPYLFYGGHHFMKECPRHEEISKFLKSNLTPAIQQCLPIPSHRINN